MSEMTLLHADLETFDRANRAQQADNAWPLDKIVLVVVLGAAYACAVFAVALPIYVWVF
jgi:hypothetical protein